MILPRGCVVGFLGGTCATTAIFLVLAPGSPTLSLTDNVDDIGLCKSEPGEEQRAAQTSSGEAESWAGGAEDEEEAEKAAGLSMTESSLGSYNHMDSLFRGGDGFHHSYRIPSIASAGGGRLIAFAEGRVHCAENYGHIRIVYRISDDNGSNWSSLRFLFGANDSSVDTWGNPTVVFEEPWKGGPTLGRVHLFFNHNENEFRESDTHGFGCPESRKKPWRPVQHGDRQTYYVFSDDAGETWSLRQNWTEKLLPKHLAWDAVGPGAGIKKRFEPNKGMLVVPANSRNFVSSNHGATWTSVLLTSHQRQEVMSEPTIAECADGRLYRNDRPGNEAFEKSRSRWTLHLSRPDQPAAEASKPDMDLPDPKSEGSLLSYAPDLLLFLNSGDDRSRTKMRVHLSTDCGKTWRIKRWLYDKAIVGDVAHKGGYSSMVQTGDSSVAALTETTAVDEIGELIARSIDLVKFDLDWLCEDETFCRGVSCAVACRGHSDEGSFFRVPSACVEEALGMALAADANPVVTKVQQRRDGELVWTGWVELWPLHYGGVLTGSCQGRPDAYKWGASWRRGDALLFPSLGASS